MNLSAPADLGKTLWTMYQNKPSKVRVIGLAVEVHHEDDDTRFIAAADALFPTFVALVENLRETSDTPPDPS